MVKNTNIEDNTKISFEDVEIKQPVNILRLDSIQALQFIEFLESQDVSSSNKNTSEAVVHLELETNNDLTDLCYDIPVSMIGLVAA
jgi:hypothetical protein